MGWLEELRDRWRRHRRPESLSNAYRRIAAEIDPHDLQRIDADSWLTEADLIGDLTGDHFSSRRILDYYTEDGYVFALERYGLLGKIRDLGFDDPHFTFETAEPKRQHITCHAAKEGVEHLLMDLMMGRIRRPAPEGLEPRDELEFLSIEWMMLQNPSIEFAPDHPRWPGQDHPGLGLTQEVMLLHIQSARRLELDGVINHPSRYHIAYLGREHSWFLDPRVQGRFDALRQALSGLELGDATWRMERGEVRWADDGSAIEWLPEDYVFPTTKRLAAYLQSPFYEEPRLASHEQAKKRGVRFGLADPG